MDKKIVTSIGGLGNQMFCYAFYRKLCVEYPDIPFYMDISDVWDKRFDRGAEFLHVFPNVDIRRASSADIWDIEGKLTFSYRGKGSRYLRMLVDFINKRTMGRKRSSCITEEIFKYSNNLIASDNWNKIGYFDGFWQTIDYYIPYIEELKYDFQYLQIDDVTNRQLAEHISSVPSVSVHVRRGDYVGEILDILDTSYYRKIIIEVLQDAPNSVFFFFSNDPKYVEEEYSWLTNKVIVTNNYGINSFRDMQLMSLCKINIIANSTFSIWAALLNNNKCRKVYYPDHFCKGEKMQEINIPGFIRCQVE